MNAQLLRKFFSAILILLIANTGFGQSQKAKTEVEIKAALKAWNQAAKKADLNQFTQFFDDTSSILLVSSDSGEIYKGKTEIFNWLGGLFRQNYFEWDMKRIEIDSYQNTAWVFMDGTMMVSNNSGVQVKTPYRFTGVLVNKNNAWKWRLFTGSIPEGE